MLTVENLVIKEQSEHPRKVEHKSKRSKATELRTGTRKEKGNRKRAKTVPNTVRDRTRKKFPLFGT